MNIPGWPQVARDQWSNRGDERPPFADEPGPGQESVWDYPRPPAVVPDGRTVEVHDDAGRLIARTTHALRVLETSHPPTFYVPSDAVTPGALAPTAGASHCEWKGRAEYVALAGIGTDRVALSIALPGLRRPRGLGGVLPGADRLHGRR